MKYKEIKERFERDGFAVVENHLSPDELSMLQAVSVQLLSNQLDASTHRHDLGCFKEQKIKGKENICQIMWPSLYAKHLPTSSTYRNTLQLVKSVLGDDMEFDFDMIIAKEPHTNTETPPHQDEAYWPDLPDKRAVTVWIAIDKTTEQNGCMWFVPGSNLGPLKKHSPAGGKHALSCDSDLNEFIAAPIEAGGCTLHHGRTLHYSRGNNTSSTRRGFILNFRPKAMIKAEREKGFDHGLKGVENIIRNTNEHNKLQL